MHSAHQKGRVAGVNDLQELDQQVVFYKSISLSENTKKAYSVHRKTYISFCLALGVSPVPASPQLLCRYVAFLSRRLAYSSIRQYLNIVRIIHAEWGYPNPCEENYDLKVTLRGIRRHLGDQVHRKAPITPELLVLILSKLDISKVRGAAVWAACLLMFYGLLRRSNVMTTPHKFDPSKHLRREDLHFSKTGLIVRIRWTKTIQYRDRELKIPYPWSPTNVLCPTKAVFNAIRLSPHAPVHGPALVLDATPTPAPLSPSVFIKDIRDALQQGGQDVSTFAGHSFRRGGASWAFANGIDIETIRILGDWQSQAYTAYILPTEKGLSKATATMLAATTR